MKRQNRYWRLFLMTILVPMALVACSDDDPPATNNSTNTNNTNNNLPDMENDVPEDMAPVICTSGERQCEGSDIQECSADGTAWAVAQTCEDGEACMGGECTIIYGIESLTASTMVVPERSGQAVNLVASHRAAPKTHGWRQVAGPHAPMLVDEGPEGATLDFSNIEVASDTVYTFELSATWETGVPGALTASDVATVEIVVQAVDLVPARAKGPIGGATIAATEVEQNGERYIVFNQGGRLHATQHGVSNAPIHELYLGAYIHDIAIVEFEGAKYAILALGAEGIGIVDVTDVTAMVDKGRVGVNYEKLGVMFAEGGGAILTEDITGSRSTIAALETDGTTLWIANADFGLQKTALSNLLGATQMLEADGTLLIDAEIYTQQYAGEHPWGGPLSLTRFGGKIFAAQAFLGMGIFDEVTLEQVGRYNLYVDTSVSEDWFIDMDVRTQVQTDTDNNPFIDAFTGMPDYRQTNFEILEAWKNDVDAPTPWADFDRYGKFYYLSQDVAVATHGARTLAYIAYGLGGLVAVDVTGYDTATSDNFLVGDYLGYVPGVPAHGPDEPRRDQTDSLYPYYGAGMLKEAGVSAVSVVGNHVLYTDHFAGLVILDHADAPETHWRQAGGPFDNDKAPQGGGAAVLGDHWPDYEWVTGFDMSPWDPTDHESLPEWMYHAPSILTTGEIGGHGRGLAVLETTDLNGNGGADVLMLAGAGGMSLLDINLNGATFNDRFSVLRTIATTTEIGAAADGTPTALINIGHTQGVTSTPNYLYVADGPHGVSVWEILDGNGMPIDDPRLVANTLQDEYPQIVDGVTIYPATHAWGVIYEPSETSIYAVCQSVGLRRINVSEVEIGNGTPGAPLLIRPLATDIFEHNGEAGSVDGFSMQDHAYDVYRRGNLAYVADGSNGLTIYDVTKDPTDLDSGFVVGNLGSASGRPPLGRASSVTVWTNETTGKDYAFMSAGQFGIGVVDVTDPTMPTLVKAFEPIKIEDGKIGHADGRNVDVHVVGDHVFFSYTSFGLVSYSIADLLEPLPEGVDPAEIWKKSETGTTLFDYRPDYADKYKLNEEPGLEEFDAEALYMEYTNVGGRVLFYVAYGSAGVAIIDWTDPTNATLVSRHPTIHEATAVTVQNGRVYVADHDGGIMIFK